MSTTFADESVAAMRTLVLVVERELAAVAPSAQLKAAWDQLVTILALDAVPEVRSCPRCSEPGMRAATRCSRCWLSMPPQLAIAPAAND